MPTRTERDANRAMRHNQRLTVEELREEAFTAISNSGKRQADVARDLDVTEGAVSRALKETGTHLAGLQQRIIEHLTPYQLEREPAAWRARKTT